MTLNFSALLPSVQTSESSSNAFMAPEAVTEVPQPPASSANQPKKPPVSKEENAQRQAQANLGTGRQEKGMKFYLNEKSATLTITDADVGTNGTVYLKGCSDCVVVFDTPCCKVMIESCDNLDVTANQRIMTQTIEVWKCENVEVKMDTTVKTIQVDLCKNVRFHFRRAEQFHSVVWAATDDLELRLLDDEMSYPKLTTGFDIISDDKNFPELNREIDQFIIRIIKGKLLTEQVIRLENGFPSTRREAKEFDDRLEFNMKKLAEDAGITIGRKNETAKTKRNDPCTCGSKRKFKQCCGKA